MNNNRKKERPTTERKKEQQQKERKNKNTQLINNVHQIIVTNVTAGYYSGQIRGGSQL